MQVTDTEWPLLSTHACANEAQFPGCLFFLQDMQEFFFVFFFWVASPESATTLTVTSCKTHCICWMFWQTEHWYFLLSLFFSGKSGYAQMWSEMKLHLQVGPTLLSFKPSYVNHVLTEICIHPFQHELRASLKTNKHQQWRFLWTKSICGGMSGLFGRKGK